MNKDEAHNDTASVDLDVLRNAIRYFLGHAGSSNSSTAWIVSSSSRSTDQELPREYRQGGTIPANVHEHLSLAFIFSGHPDSITDFEWRDLP